MASSKIPISQNRRTQYTNFAITSTLTSSSKHPTTMSDPDSKYDHLVKEFEEYKEDKERELQSLEEELDILEGELRMAQNGGLETQVAEELELLRQTIVDLQSQLEDKTTKEIEQNEQMDLLTTENEDLNALLKEKQREINELEVEKTPEAPAPTEHDKDDIERIKKEYDEIVSNLERELIQVSESCERTQNELSATELDLEESNKNVKQLQAELKGASEEIETLKRDIRAREKKISSLENDQSKEKHKNDYHEQELKQLQGKYQDVMKENIHLLQAKANQSLEHQERLAQLRTDLLKEQDEICQENRGLKTKVDHLVALNEDAARESSDLKNKLKAKEEDGEKQLLESEELNKQLDDLKEENKSLQERFQQEMQKFESTKGSYDDQISDLEQNLSDSNEKYTDLISQKLKLESEVDTQKREYEKLNLKYEQTQSRLDEVEQKMNDRCEQVSQEEKDRLSKELVAEKETNENLLEDLKFAEKEISQLREEVISLESELRFSKEERQSHTNTQASLSFEPDDIEYQLEQELQNLNWLRKSNEEKRELEHKLSDAVADRNEMQIRLSYVTRELEEKDSIINEMLNTSSKKTHSDKVALSEMELTNRQLQNKINQLEMEIESLQNESKSLKMSLELTQSELCERDRELEMTSANLSRKAAEMEDLRLELEKQIENRSRKSSQPANRQHNAFLYNSILSERPNLASFLLNRELPHVRLDFSTTDQHFLS